MKKLLIALLLVALIIGGVIVAWQSVENDSGAENENHEHTFEMRFDDYYHWEEAICHSIEPQNKKPHDYDAEFNCITCRYPMRNIVEPSMIMHSLNINVTNAKFTYKCDEDVSDLIIDGDIVKIIVNGTEIYYKFLDEGNVEIYTFENESWHRNVYNGEFGHINNFIEGNYPGLLSLCNIGTSSDIVIDFDVIAKTTKFEFNGNWEDLITEYSGVVYYNDSYAVTKIDAEYVCHGIKYEIIVEYDYESLVCPEIPSEGMAVETTPNGTYIIKDMGDCTDVNVIIPAEINGIPVTEIAPEAFKNNTNLRSIVIPGTVKIIGESAFEGCVSLQKVILQDGVEEIGEKAFYMSNPRAYLEFTESVTKIGADAFDYDTAYFDKGTWNFIGNINNYVQIEFENNCSNPGESRYMLLNGEEMKEVTIDTATRINSFAFLNADGIQNYYIGKQVTYFGEQSITSFRESRDENQNLIILPHNLYYEGTLEEFMNIEKNGLWTLGEWNLYCNNELIDTLVIENMEEVPLGMFSQCVGLKHLVIKEGVKSVGRYAFYGINFETVELPESLTKFEYWAFLHRQIPDNTGIFTMVEYYEGDIYHLAIYMRVGDNPYYLLVERSYTNVEINENVKYRQQQQWECPEFEDWFEDPRPTT